MEETQEKSFDIKIMEQVEAAICRIAEEQVQPANVDYLYKLVDVHKDLCNEKYWKEKIDMYNERNYGRGYSGYGEGYGRRGVKGTGRGRYRNSGRYSEDIMEEMYSNYGEYSEGKENYGADMETLKSLEKMLKSVKKFMKHLINEAQSKEEMDLIQETAHEISEF